MDIHAFQPDGQEIYYENRGPLSSTGKLNADNGRVGSNGLAVENIAWTTAPSGSYRIAVTNFDGCEMEHPNVWQPVVDYKLYVQIDGVTSVYERTVPAGDKTTYEVLSFVYSQNGRSVTGAVDFDTSVIALPAEVEEKKREREEKN